MTGNISAVTFTVENIDETRVLVKITDPVTSIHVQGKQLTIRDILKKDLKYKISYYKSGSTGKVTCSTTNSCTVYCATDINLDLMFSELSGRIRLLCVWFYCFVLYSFAHVLCSPPCLCPPSHLLFPSSLLP